jgi:hypothetical protein
MACLRSSLVEYNVRSAEIMMQCRLSCTTFSETFLESLHHKNRGVLFSFPDPNLVSIMWQQTLTTIGVSQVQFELVPGSLELVIQPPTWM